MPGSVKLVSLSWFYQLGNGETWEDGATNKAPDQPHYLPHSCEKRRR
ncbi:hypothetical protein ACFTWF_32975 [Rhodococcus sp. NPDC056960]